MKATQQCSVSDCDRPVLARQLCSRHYQRAKKRPDRAAAEGVVMAPLVPRLLRLCEVDGCGRVYDSRGLCAMHLTRMVRHGNLTGVRPNVSAEERFERFVDRNDPCGCWLWRGPVNSLGYGRLNVGRLTGATSYQVYAHRWSYEKHIGPIPHGMYVLHSCDNPPCVNPAHLRTGTPLENVRDMHDRGRGNNVPGTGKQKRARRV